MYISYSGYKKLIGCAFAYWHSYINKTEIPGPDDRLGSVYGSSVGRLFERFYAEKVWKSNEPQAQVMSWVQATVDQVLHDEVSPSKYREGGTLLWHGQKGATRHAYKNREEIVADVRDAVARGFRIIRQQRLLGPRAEAEVKLDQTIEGHRIAGRSDFVILRTKPHNDLTITDGKGSKYRDAFVDKRQLLWYAMLLQKKEGHLPDRIGFIFWRFEPSEAMDWFDVTQSEVDALLQSALAEIEKVEAGERQLGTEKSYGSVAEVFKKTPNAEGCQFCPFATDAICPEGVKMNKSAKKKPRKTV